MMGICYALCFTPFVVPQYDIFHFLDDCGVVIGGNTKMIQPNLAWSTGLDAEPLPRLDGYWGIHEYSLLPQPLDLKSPYLAFVLTGASGFIAGLRIREGTADPNPHFVRHPHWPDRGYLDKSWYKNIRHEAMQYIVSCRKAIEKIEGTQPYVASRIQMPVVAIRRAYDSAVALGMGDLFFRDAVQILGGLKRAFAEIEAFLIWSEDYSSWLVNDLHKCANYPTRGVIARDTAEYNKVKAWGVPVWLFISSSHPNDFDNSKLVPMGELPCSWHLWDSGLRVSSTDYIRDRLVHNKGMEYYPPSVSDPSTYERAARGYHPRADSFVHDARAVRDLIRMGSVKGEPLLYSEAFI